MSDWWDYVVRVSGTTVQKEMAARSGISETAFTRWKKKRHTPEASHVITFARAHGRPPIEALVAAGYITEKDAADRIEIQRGADTLTDAELIAEVQRRMGPGSLPHKDSYDPRESPPL
ncbi:helix-turn-helix domain-containing protein [Mycobacteroides abscessus]|uniref:helix-turn-helix domain-containing protein n=1 Tax=Mycobacteroides abscessus TaxID=36809 RepID=UPI0004631332|nr:helix-turn-helix transcriptional regulator [Mycobacteroides abscessus]MBL3752321.1 helix-turn-helix transcriptional regulator [Mycobacteroides abscessus subsp. massiliense]ORA92152.1 transcriptional regulator [Mycobacteroides abscessus subsp. massiliense]